MHLVNCHRNYYDAEVFMITVDTPYRSCSVTSVNGAYDEAPNSVTSLKNIMVSYSTKKLH